MSRCPAKVSKCTDKLVSNIINIILANITHYILAIVFVILMKTGKVMFMTLTLGDLKDPFLLNGTKNITMKALCVPVNYIWVTLLAHNSKN